MTGNDLQFIGILVSVTALLGWVLKQVIQYFISSSKEKTEYIEKLVASNQTNSDNFVNTINHQRTLDREMQQKHLISLSELKKSIDISNEVNTRLISFMKNNGK